MQTVLEYVRNLRKQYSNEIINSTNKWFFVGKCENERSKTRYYSIIEERGPKEYVLKKGSLLRTLEEYDNVNSSWRDVYISRRPLRTAIKTSRIVLGKRAFDLVIEDFVDTSLSTLSMFNCLVVGKGGYTYEINKNELRFECLKVKEAEYAVTSDKSEKSKFAGMADYISLEQQYRINKQTERLIAENEEKKQLELEKRLKTFIYNYEIFGSYIEKELEYNKQKFEIALTMLETDKTVYVTGKSRSGKTFLCREVAGKFCNINTSNFENHAKYAHNLMWIKATMNEETFIQKFAEFCMHNRDSKRCLLVINEAKKDNLYNLLPMWEKMDADGKKYKDFLKEGLTFNYNGIDIEIPKGLAILANVADGQNTDDLEQVLNRFNQNRINMNDISDELVDISKFTDIPIRILELLSELQTEIIEETENESKSFIVIYHLKYDRLNYLKKSLKSIKRDIYLWEDDVRVKEIEEYIISLEGVNNEV